MKEIDREKLIQRLADYIEVSEQQGNYGTAKAFQELVREVGTGQFNVEDKTDECFECGCKTKPNEYTKEIELTKVVNVCEKHF